MSAKSFSAPMVSAPFLGAFKTRSNSMGPSCVQAGSSNVNLSVASNASRSPSHFVSFSVGHQFSADARGRNSGLWINDQSSSFYSSLKDEQFSIGRPPDIAS